MYVQDHDTMVVTCECYVYFQDRDTMVLLR